MNDKNNWSLKHPQKHATSDYNYLPRQIIPSPRYPSRQAQARLPAVLVHVA